MKNLRWLWCAALLAACAGNAPRPSVSAIVPPELQVCPDGATPPPTPPPPRSVAQVMNWAVQLYAALIRSEHARDGCAGRLARLNRWIETEGLLNGRR